MAEAHLTTHLLDDAPVRFGTEAGRCHVPLPLLPFGRSTRRGS